MQGLALVKQTTANNLNLANLLYHTKPVNPQKGAASAHCTGVPIQCEYTFKLLQRVDTEYIIGILSSITKLFNWLQALGSLTYDIFSLNYHKYHQSTVLVQARVLDPFYLQRNIVRNR
jgi:hypothetical protein